MQFFYKAAGIALLAATSGCCNNFGWPTLCGEGPARDQRARAQFFDPYPEIDMAPNIGGGRPRDFDQPFAPPLQTQLEHWDSTRSQAGP